MKHGVFRPLLVNRSYQMTPYSEDLGALWLPCAGIYQHDLLLHLNCCTEVGNYLRAFPTNARPSP